MATNGNLAYSRTHQSRRVLLRVEYPSTLSQITTKEKPMFRVERGTVQRRPAIEAYQDELDALYLKGDHPASEAPSSLDMHDPHTLQGTLRTLIEQITDLSFEDVSDDFFAYGMDSLHVINLAKQISSSITGPAGPSQSIESKLIYDNPSIDKLAAAISGRLESASTNGPSMSKTAINRMSKMQELLEKYTADLPAIAKPPTIHKGKPLIVLLTGSTGSLGPFVFNALLANSSVKKIYCLNRSVNGEERQ
ncbi:MAG: hypothetical protein Q9187_008696, partial [Circinaria calcarea]